MSLPRVPLDSSNERQHRTIIATTVNELVKTRPPFDRTSAEVAAGVTPVDYGYAPGDARRYGIVMDDEDAATSNAAILNALDAATWPKHITLTFPDGDVWIGDQVVLDSGNLGVSCSHDTLFRYNGTADQPAFIFSSNTVTLENFRIQCETTHDWSNEDFVGLRIISMRGQSIDVKQITGFTINFQAWGSSTLGIGYNRIKILRSFDAYIHVDIHSAVADAWINENEWYLTSIDNSSNFPTDIDSYGVRIKAESGAYTGINNNVFRKPSFELEDGNGSVERIPIWFDNAGLRNNFYDCRVENGTSLMRVDSDTFQVIYNTMDVLTLIGSNFTGGSPPDEWVINTDGGLGFANIVRTRRFGSDRPAVWESPDLVEKSFPSTSSRMQTEGCFYEHGIDDAGVERYDGQGRILKDWLRLGGSTVGMGVWVDTTTHKELEVFIGSDVSRRCGVAIVCYDSSGSLLDSGDTGYPHVAAEGLTDDSTLWGYSYRSTGANKLTFRVGSQVAKIKLILRGDGTTAGGYLRSFSVHGYQSSVRPYAMRVWSGFPTQGRLVDDSPATIRNGGYTLRGAIATHDDAATAVTSYWQCSASGWNATAWAATTAYVLNQMVENDTGKIYVCTIAGTSAGAGGPTGTGSAITDNTVTWKYIGTLATWTAGPTNP